LLKEKSSKFFAYALPVQSELAFKSELQQLKKKHFDATHHCYALRLAPKQNFEKWSDDGEPANTAGKPILHAIYRTELFEIGVVVVRYFGGTQLGKRGLIDAYADAAAQALSHAVRVEKVPAFHVCISAPIQHVSGIFARLGQLNLNFEPQFLESEVLVRCTIKETDAYLIEALKKDFFFAQIETID